MSKPLVVIADTDENYLMPLEYKFLETLGDKIELEIISDRAYYEEFFSAPRTAEIVAVSEKLYSRELLKHNINSLFVLAEENDAGSTAELSVSKIFKYTGVKEIFNELIYRSRDSLFDDSSEKETKIITLYSAIGGSGKTSMGLGLASCLAQNHRRVLYVNTETIQGFSYYLADKTGMPNEGVRAIREDKQHVYNNVKYFIRKEGFAYVPPFAAALDALNLEKSIYLNLIKNAKASKEYDFIIVDVEAGYDKEKMDFLQLADKAAIVLLQDEFSVYKTEYLLHNIDLHDREKYLFICNCFQEEKENAYVNSQMQKKFSMNEYVEYASEPIRNIKELSMLKGIQKLAYMFI